MGSRFDNLTELEWLAIGHRLEFSEQQLLIARELARGGTVQSAAFILEISPNTVKTHIKRMHRKVKVDSRLALVLRMADALEEGRRAGDTRKGDL